MHLSTLVRTFMEKQETVTATVVLTPDLLKRFLVIVQIRVT